MRRFIQNIVFAIRQLRKSPAFALTSIVTIALGIAATTAIFSLVNTVLLRPLPFAEADRLMTLQPWNDRYGRGTSMSYPDFFDWRAQNKSFSAIAAYHGSDFSLTGSGEPRHLDGQSVASDFFRILGVLPALGRDFNTEDEKPGVRSAILSHELWESAFGSANDVLGRSVTLNGKSYTVVGVMPSGFEFPIQTPAPALWVSIGEDGSSSDGDPLTSQRGAHFLDIVGRLKPAVSAAQAQADLAVIARNLSKQYPQTNSHFAGAVVKGQLDEMVGDSRQALQTLFAAVSFVLLIACANVAGLMLARSSQRRAEIAIRTALGASRGQIMRQMLVESVLLALIGGALGVVLSGVLLRVLVKTVPADLPRLNQVAIDGRVLVFAAAASIFTGLLFGLLPAWRMSQVDLSGALRDSTRTSSAGRSQHRMQNMLVVCQTAIGLILLVGSGLLIRSFVQVLRVDPGFDPRNVLIANLNLPENRYNATQQAQFYDRMLANVQTIPGVRSVSAGEQLPLTGHNMGLSFDIEGHPLPEGERNTARVSIVSPRFFETLRIPVLRGREFRPSDDTKSAPVVIVSESFARKFFPESDALGKHINPGIADGNVNDVPREIVGIAADIKAGRLTEDITPRFYLPFSQAAVLSPSLVIRTKTDPLSIIGPLRAQITAMDKDLPIYGVKTLDGLVEQNVAQPRFSAFLLSAFAGMALLLSAVGLYGLLSYLVAQRTLEIGVRVALGAPRSSVWRMILNRGLMLAATGVGIGIVAAILLARLMSGMLFGIRPLDPSTFVVVSVIPLVVALIASGIPAYRAARLDPMKTLREQ